MKLNQFLAKESHNMINQQDIEVSCVLSISEYINFNYNM